MRKHIGSIRKIDRKVISVSLLLAISFARYTKY